MRSLEDKFAKWILGALLREFGKVTTDQEIVETRQRIDIWFELQRLEGLAQAGLPGRIAAESVMIEVFSQPPGEEELFQCRRKQFNWKHELQRDGKASPVHEAWYPRLWIISRGTPSKVLHDWEFRPLPGWPRGVYESQGVRLIVLGDLPSSRDTLSLRLLDSPDRRLQAIRSFCTLPAESVEKRLLYPVLCRVYGEAMTEPKTSLTEKDLEVDPLDLFDKYLSEARADGERTGEERGRLAGIQTGIQEGMEAGIQTGMRSLLLKQCEQKFGEISQRRRVQLESAPLEQLTTWATRLLAATSLDEVFDDADQG